MGFEKTENAKLYTAIDGDTLEAIAERETAEGNPITWQDLAKYNWGTDDPATINELLRDELGARKRDAANNFVVSSDDTPRSELRIPKKFQKPALPLEKTHILRVRKKTIAPQFQACSSIPGATFETDKSFLRPSVVDSIESIENAILENPDAKIMIFGHTDKVGSDSYNKALSERRAKSVYAFITDDADTWEDLYKEEDWGTKAIQEILKDFDDPAFDPGPVDGIYGQKTRQAVRNFQEARELTVDGIAGPNTRKQLFSDYMTGKHDVKVTQKQFMEPKYMGCSEFNPVDIINDKAEINRRVVFFLFDPERLPNLPCIMGDISPCKHQSIADQPRFHDGFQCSFYDSLACRCPGEKKHIIDSEEITIHLHDHLGHPMPGAPWRLDWGNGNVDEDVTDDGWIRLETNACMPNCILEWGVTTDSGFAYRTELAIGCSQLSESQIQHQQMLNNLGYHANESLDTAVRAYQHDQGLTVTGLVDGKIPQDTGTSIQTTYESAC